MNQDNNNNGNSNNNNNNTNNNNNNNNNNKEGVGEINYKLPMNYVPYQGQKQYRDLDNLAIFTSKIQQQTNVAQ